MTASKLLPSTNLALLQERILSRIDYSSRECVEHLVDMDKYSDLLKYTRYSNLHLRQEIIKQGLTAIMTGFFSVDEMNFARLVRGLYWLEGPDYCLYVKAASDWFLRVRPNSGVFFYGIEATERAYLAIAAPDGTLPVPEATGRTYPTTDLPDISNDKYIVKRWPSGAYLLIDVGTECDPLNLHDWMSAGYFALSLPLSINYIKTVIATGEKSEGIANGHKWVSRCETYKSFSWSNVLDDSRFRALFPKGALLPGWRLKPPRVTVERGDGWVQVTWKNGWLLPTAKRRISWTDGVVRVSDQTGWFRRVSKREWVVG